MASKIKILPQKLVEKIAAGEVVDRPYSVVKELIENSIDAGADKISIHIKGGGIKEIRVTDNGCGMNEDEVLLAIRRHATSKISSEEDLERIRTLGFRGEALPSIAAVSRMTIITRREDSIVGTRLYVEGGEVKEVRSVGSPIGTSVLVQDLFFNTPARRKFLKGERYEFRQIYSIVEKYALIYENIHFKLVNEGREIFNLPPSDLKSRIARLWGNDIAKDMIEIRAANKFRIEGLISKPYLVRKDRRRIFCFVNGRYVKSKLMEEAIIEGYGTMLFRDSYPLAVLKLSIPPEDVDVNVHPAKLFVKFRDEEKIKEVISSLIWDTLSSGENIPAQYGGSAGIGIMKINRTKQMVFEIEEGKRERKIEDYLSQMRTLPMEVLGQVDDTYIILKSPEGLIIVDQHAAHERIRYEKFIRDMRDRKIQELLDPLILNLNYEDYKTLLELKDELRDYGFIIDDFGSNSIMVRGIPPILTKRDAEEALKEIAQMGVKSLEKIRDDAIKLISCKGAIKAHQKLSIFEMEKLMMELFRCENPYTCPHGRPTMIKLRSEDLEKMFKRKE